MKCLAKKTQYQKAENALTAEYGKNPPIHLDIGEYEKIMKEVARVAL